MPRKNLLFCPRSMKEVSSSERSSYGASRTRRSTKLFYGLLLCIFVPNYTEAAYTAPSNCTSVVWFYSGSKVQNISCAGQQLLSVPKDNKEGSDVFKFDLSNNQISSLAIDEFQYFINLQELDLSYNQIPSFTVDTFSNLTSLQLLSLAANDLKALPSGTFASTSVTTLDLSYTNLSSITKEHLQNLNNLQEVNLSHNNLTSLERHLFKDLTNLETVDLSWNQLIDLDNNQVFKKATGLKTLDVSNNKIVDVHRDFMRDADALTNLDLSNNLIASLHENVFDDTPDLETIYLNDNLLPSIHEKIFEKLNALQEVYLNNNQLTSIPEQLFKNNPNLQDLYLNANSLSTIPTDLWQYQTTLKVDISSNAFICNCSIRDYLFAAWYDANKEIKNVDSTTCTDTTLSQHVYLDYNDASCSGSLGAACTVTNECLVRNSKCHVSECICSDNFYDTNGVTTDGGLCQDKVSLDYPCPSMDAACAGDNVECTVKSSSSSDTYCLCKSLYYDDNPQYLDGTCRLKVELGEACSITNNMCRPDNSICGTSSICECHASYYDSNGPTNSEGECLEKLSLNSSCNETYQCAASNSECSSNLCQCSAGHYDFTNIGQCQDPSSFYSCSPASTSTLEISFSIVKDVTSETVCKRHCFEQDERYYHMEGSTQCICGSPSSDQKCCPMVTTACSGRIYLGPTTLLAEAGINVTHTVRPTAGFSHSFPVTTSLDAIDQLKAGFGDSSTVTTVNASTATFQHTYTHSGLFWLKVSACAANFGVCEDISIPIKVQVPTENVTTYLTGVVDAEVSSYLSASFSATFKQGYDIDFIWTRTFNGAVTKKMGCASGLTQHRHSCIKLESTPLTFSAAKTACSADGTLLKIDFMAELSEIVTALSASTDLFFVGAQRIGGVWQWFDGTKTFFSDDDLIVSTNGDCLILDGSSSQLTSASCTSSAKYVCMSDPESCPKGGNLMSNGYCYVLASTESASSKSWTDANDYCTSNFGGWLANMTDSAVQTNVTALLTSEGVGDAWIGLHQVKGVYQWGDYSVFNIYSPPYMPVVTSNNEDCFVTTNAGTWNSQDCSNIKDFVCQYSENIQRVTVPSFTLGSGDIGVPAGQDLIHVIPIGSLSATTTDLLLFPGLPFSRSGNIQEWTFCSINVVSGSYNIAFLIWRPHCTSGTLVQAGCIPTMFASCSSGTPSCIPSTSCSDSEKFCYLSSSCKSMNESCTCNSETSSSTGCGTYGTAPTYELVSETMATITETGQKCYKLSDGDTSIQEGDIIGLQFPTGNNIVRCEDRPSSADQQTAYSASASDYLVKTNTFPSTYTPIQRTCDMQVIYTQDLVQSLPANLGYTSLVGSHQLAVSLVETETKQLSVLLEETIDDLYWVYPVLSIASASSNSFGTVYTEVNQAYDFTLAAGRGTNLMSTFSFDTSQTKLFTNSCTSAVIAAVGNDCNSTMYWSDKPFSSFSYNTSTIGTMTAEIQVTNSLGSEKKNLIIKTEEKISGITFSLKTSSLIPNNVAVNSLAQFDLEVTSGTGLNYSYTVGGSLAISTTSSLSYTFPTIGTFVVQGTVENILSTETKSITVYAKKAANFANCQFSEPVYIAAVGLSLTLELQCDVTIGSEVSTVWMLSDRSTNITSSISTASTTPVVWTQAVSFSSVSAVTVEAFAQDPFEAVSKIVTVNVYNRVPSVSVVSNGTDVFGNVIVQFTASIPSSPGNYGTVVYSFDYGDGTTDNSSSGIVTHSYSTGGNYSVSVTASNGPSDDTTATYVAVYEEVTGLKLTDNGPKEKSNAVTFTASVTTGNFISYHFKSLPSAFEVTQSSPTYTHTFTNANDYNVTVTAFNFLSQESESITAYVMNPTDLTISGFKVDGNDVSDCLETKIGRNFSVAVIHYSVATVLCDWDFGDGTVLPGTTCSKTYAYPSAGNFTVMVTAKYTPQNAKQIITEIVCLHERISSPSISIATPVALPSIGKVTKNVTLAVATGDPLTYSWSTNATGGSASGATFPVEFSSEGSYFISVIVSNAINSFTVNKTVTVIEEISGMTISCSSCINKSGQFYVRSNTAYSFTVSSITGTGVTFSWDFGDLTTGSGETNTHTYTAIGTHNLTVTGSSAVTALETRYVTIHIETLIVGVSLKTYRWDWLNDVQNISIKNLDITKLGKFEATVSPVGMDNLEHVWIFETGLAEEVTTTNVGEHQYTETGLKSCTVTVKNSLGNMTSVPFRFYVIEKIESSSLRVAVNADSISGSNTSETNTYKVALNELSVFNASSEQIVVNTVQYFLRLRMKDPVSGSWILQHSTSLNTDSTLTFNFSTETVYSLEVSITNSLGSGLITVYIEAVEAISGPFISAPVGEDGNITLNSMIVLTGGVTVGEHLSYNWFYGAAPNGQSLPSTTASSVTITPGVVGQYIVTLEVSNPVSSTLSVNYTINVMVGVSGVGINVVMQYTDAVKVSNSLTFSGVVSAGTGLSYNWDAFLAGSSQSTGNVQTFSFLFNTQALYNITLSIENYASSGSAYKEIYSLYDVPSFNLQNSGATFSSSISQYIARTNDLITFSCDISNTDYMQFDWKVNGTSEVSTETFPKNFTSPGVYSVQLNASNLVSSENNGITILTQDPLAGFSIQNCIGTYLMDTIVTLTASHSRGSDVTVMWSNDGKNVSGTATTVQYSTVGNYSVTVTGSNYVSQETKTCWITIQGEVRNLKLTISEYKFVNYSVTFNVTGDYINPATFTWIFSHGVTLTTTNSATLDLDFAAKGTYTLEVTVANNVSSSKVNLTFEVEELACSKPTLKAVGSTQQAVRRSRPVEFSVDVSTDGCTDYISMNSWKIYTASSCADSLTNEYTLPSSIKTNLPNLQLTAKTLDYDTYCVVFTHSYENTPVEQYKYINLTVVESALTAVLRGGHERGANEGTTLTFDASESYDPDEVPGTTLIFAWSCTQSMGTATAAAVCANISAITVSSANLTGLTLTPGESYIVNVNVSATGRMSGSTSQLVNIQVSGTPLVSIKCVSCEAYGHFFQTSSRSLAFEGTCSSGCIGSVTYKWTVTDTTTNTALVIDSSQTSTGTDQENFVLMHSNLQSGRAYSFKLEATVGSKTGFSQMTLQPSSKPSTGNCSIRPLSGFVPLSDKLKYSCSNIADSDSLSQIYYKVTVKYTSVYGKSINAYYGPKAENEIYLVPFPGTSDSSVDVEITAVNDYGAENDGYQKTISFTAPTLLSTQSNKMDYIVDQMIVIMRTVVKLNNPSILRQFLLSVLGYLNDQSLNNVGTSAQRKAIRDVIINSLSGLPMSSIYDIQQTASALELLVEYSEEISLDTISKALNEIDSMKQQWESTSIPRGADRRDYDSDTAIDVIAYILKALKSPSSVVSDNGVLTKFDSLSNYVLEVSSSVVTVTSSSPEAQTQDLSEQSIKFNIDLLIITLKATIPNDQAIEKSSSENTIKAMHVSTDRIVKELVSDLGMTLNVPGDVLSTYSSYSEDSVFQLFYVSSYVQFDFGFSDSQINTVTLSTSFHSTTGDSVSVANLPDGEEIIMYMFSNDVTPYTINETGIQYSQDYNPLLNMNYSSARLEQGKLYAVDLNMPDEAEVGIHFQVRANSTSSAAKVHASLYKNGVQYTATSNANLGPKVITMEMMNNYQHDHTEYTFFIPPEEYGDDDAFEIRINVTEDVEVAGGQYHSKCEYFKESVSSWDNSGCKPLEESTSTTIKCSCNHMTSFGGSLFVSPDQLNFADITEIDIARNPVAIITCSVIIGLYIILVVAFRRMDLMDLKRISVIPLCGKDGSFKYEVTIVTGRLPGAGSTAHVGIRLFGEYGRSTRQHIIKAGAFQRNCSDTFIIAYDVNLGDLKKLQIWHDNRGTSPSWYLSHVIVNDLQTDNKYYFFGNTWLSLEKENGNIQKELKVAGAHEMSQFSHRLKTAVFNSLADKHLWLSLFNRPAQSRFTRVQRVTCCVTILFVFVVVNAMWYGLLKKSNTELGFEGFGWEEVVLALVSNIMVLPFSVGLVFLFKKSRSKPNFLDHVQKPQTAQTLEIENLCENSQGGSFESSNTGAIPYDLERESTIDSVPPTALGLHRSRHVAKTHRENTDDSFIQKRQGVAVTSSSSESPLWNEDGIMKWPDSVPTFDDGTDSRPSTGSTMAGTPGLRHPPVKAGGSTPGAARKSKTVKKGDAGELLDELDKLEHELKETESRSVKSSGSKKSISLRKPTMHKSQWGSLEDILQSDDESVAESSGKMKKRGSRTSQSMTRKFNPREDPRINGNGRMWPKSRESVMSGESSGSRETRGGVTAGLRPGYYNEMTMESRDIKIPVHKEGCTLPPWCIYIAYVICLLLSVFSIIIVILYCFKFGSEESLKWVLALILSLILSFLVIEPLKAMLIAVYVVAMFKNVEQDEDDDFIDIDPTFDNSNEKIKDVKFKPISGFALLQAREEGRKIHRMNIMIKQFIAYVFYLWLIMVVVYVHFHYNTFLMTRHVENDFIAPTTSDHRNFTNITTIDEFWDWTETVFVDSLYKQNLTQDEEHGLLLGEARMRLIRGITMKCHAASAASRLGASSLTDRTCYGDGNYDEDTADYAEGWNQSNSNFSWRHYSAGELGSTHKIGNVATYGGGGYPQGLGTSPAETDSIISHLKDRGWIDLQTRAIIFEFAIYSAGSDMTSLVALLAEFPLTGGVITSYEIQSQKLLWFQERTVDPLMVLECILFLVVLYSVIHSALQIREIRKQYFKEIWNWYEMLTTLMALVSIGMYIGCVVEATNTFNKFLDNQTGFTNFERAVYVHVGMRYLHAWLLFLLMFKVVKQLRFIRFMYVYEKTLSKAVGHLLGTGLIYVILLLVYAQVGYLMYGQIVSGFESVGHTITTLVVMIRGSFDFWPMLDYHPIFSHFYVYSYYTFAYGIMIALVISILTSTYKQMKSQLYYKASVEMQDYEMIDFMMKRFKLWAGIQKPKPAFRRVRFPGLPSVSSRSSSSYSNRSSSSLHSAQSVTGPQFSEVQLRNMMARMSQTWQAVLKRMDKVVALDDEEESLVKRAETEMKNLNWKCRINELERQHKELLSWKNQPSTSGKPPPGDTKQRQSILKRSGAAKDNQDRKAPATVSGALSRTAALTPDDNSAQGRRPLSDQGVRMEQASTSKRRSSSTEKSKIQTFFKSIKPSKPAWNK